ncbi:MAG: TRAP transporter substrate-binding protein [Chloroflexota bacterium]
MKRSSGKTIVLGLLAGLLVLSSLLMACQAAAPTTPTATALPTFKLKFAIADKAEDPHGQAAVMFMNGVESRTQGKVDIDFYPGGQLGDWYEITEAQVTGGVDITIGLLLPQFDPLFNILYMDYMAASYQEAREMFKPGGWLTELVGKRAEELNLKVLSFLMTGALGVSNTKRPVRVPADLKGLKLRTPPFEVDRLEYQNYGASTIQMAFGEVFTALQTGTADGQDNGPMITYAYLKEQTPYYTHLRQVYEAIPLQVYLGTWQKLPAEYQKIFLEEAEKAGAWLNEQVEKTDEDYLKKMEQAGTKVIRFDQLTEAEKQAWLTTARDFWSQLSGVIGKAAVEEAASRAK